MLPIDTVTGKPWTDHALWRRIHAKFKREAEAELCLRDEHLSHGAMNAGNEYAPSTSETVEGIHGQPARTIRKVNPGLVAFKHSGADTIALLRYKAAKFLSEPQSQEEWAERMFVDTRGNALDKAIAAGEDVAASIPSKVADVPPKGEPVKATRRVPVK